MVGAILVPASLPGKPADQNEASPARDRLTAGVFILKHQSDPIGRLEIALGLVAAADAVEAKIRAAAKSGALDGITHEDRLRAAVSAGIVSDEEAAVWRRYEEIRRACIMVDDFPHDIGRNVVAEPARVTPLPDAVLARKTA